MAARRARQAICAVWSVLAVLVCWLMIVPVAAAVPARAPAAAGIRYAKVSPACTAPQPGSATCFAFVRLPVSAAAADDAGVKAYAVNDGASESGPTGGLTPSQLASAYSYEPAVGGSAQTVAIVDAYDDPDVEADLARFDEHYGLAPCTSADGCFTKVSQSGSATVLPPPPPSENGGWSLEIPLDVETVHSVCPNCKILLVEATSSADVDLAAAVTEAVSLGATEVSNSYGGHEARAPRIEDAYNHPGVVIAAATGDQGYNDWAEVNEGLKPSERPDMPASYPTVVAVGGTTLTLDEDGKRESETVWNGNGPFDEERGAGVTGGGCSTRFSAEPWQQQAPGYAASGCEGRRLAADVAAVANPRTGFAVYDSDDCGEYCEERGLGNGWITVGGTSLATPLISALYALAGGSNGVSYPSLTLYGHLGEAAALYDVSEGGNGFCDEAGLACGADALLGGLNVDCEGTTACNAAPGLDGPSGVGAPNGLGLFEPLLPTGVIAAPGSAQAGVGLSFNGAGSSDPYPGGSLASYSWNWGDGTPDGSGVAPTHTYEAPGEYTVTLTVTDSYGVKSTAVTRSITVNAVPGPVPLSSPAPSGGVSSFHTSAPLIVSDARIARASLRVSATGTVALKISCPTGESECWGKVTLRTLSAVTVPAGNGAARKRSVLTLAAGSFKVVGGRVCVVTLRLSKRADTLLGRTPTLRVRATLLAHASQVASRITQAIVTLHADRLRPHPA